VNATPLRFSAAEGEPVDFDRLSPRAIVLDLLYAPGETEFVREARARGHLAADGLTMLLHQGVAAFERWFGVEPDKRVMWDALRAATGRQ